MDKGAVVLEGIVIIVMLAYILAGIVPPIILDLIWIKRVKNGKSKPFGVLGIISMVVTIGCILNLPHLIQLIGEFIRFIKK